MNIAIIGYGKMGHMIEEIAVSRGHKVVCKIDLNTEGTFDSASFAEADLAIEFTTPKTAFANYMECFKRNKPVVSGTTGWLERMPEIEECCKQGATFFYASNFSLGVNIFAELNRKLARLMNPYAQYDVEMTEVHHVHKLDAPSGTAITLAGCVSENLDRKSGGWTLAPEEQTNKVKITAIREGEVPGIHTIKYVSDDDYIEVTHSANSRRCFAFGVVLAAEFTLGRKGLLHMSDMLGF